MKQKGTIKKSLLALNIIPIIVICFILILVSASKINAILQSQVRIKMSDLGKSIVRYIDDMYEGNYQAAEENGEIILYKGDKKISEPLGRYIDDISKETDNEITVFYYDERVITTILDKKGERFLYTKAPSTVKKDVLNNGKESFYTNVSVGEIKYYAYYIPLKNNDNTIAGMLAILEPENEVKNLIIKAVIPIFLVPIAIMIIAIIITCSYSNKFIWDVRNLENYMKEVANNNFDVELSESIYNRNDELYQIGKSTTEMKNSLRKLIEQDALTGLYNRRYGESQFKSVWNKLKEEEKVIIVMGDIDYFKKVNDTYGHSAGDKVLRVIADTIKTEVAGKGFVIRWGGEEFLICFYKTEETEAYELLKKLNRIIEATVINYEDREIMVTMTFGMSRGDVSMSVEEIIKKADDNLYIGKQNGRNQIVV